MAIHVLIADDHPIVRSGIRNELSHHPDFEIVGEAISGDEILPQLGESHADVLILDINMPGMKAKHILGELEKVERPPQVLVLTAYGDPENVLGMLKAGARGYLLKDSSPGNIADGIRAVAKGMTWLSPEVASVLLETQIDEKANFEETLSARETEVLQFLAQGYSNAQIAERLSISEGTVKNHITNIYDKLCLHTRAEAVAWAWQNGLVSSG
jgi:DNA-binding NarL/FixJ family response regulator